MLIKTELQSNNADLQSLIDLANALPDALTTETWILTLEDGSTVTKAVHVK